MATLALLIAVGLVVTIVLRPGSSSPSRPPGTAGSGSAIATVQRRDLVQTDTESGTLGHGNGQTVYDHLSGTITWLPSVGQVITPGQALFRVAGQPVILMNGASPAYRDLGPSDSAAQDILQLNRNLVALGFNPDGIVVDDAWQAATTAGVDQLQASLGETEPGTLKLGQVVFLTGARLVSNVSVQLGSQVALRAVPPAPEFVSLTTTTTTGTQSAPRGTREPRPAPQPNALAPLVALLRGESAQLRAATAQLRAAQSRTPQTGGSPTGDSGGGSGGSATPVLTTSSIQPVVTVELDPSKQREAKVGEHVTVELPSGRAVSGRISAVSAIAQSPGGTSGNGAGGGTSTNGSGSSTAVPVTITLRGHASGKGLDQASVSVNFAAARATNVLAVPVTALVAIQGGRFALQETSSPHRLIRVTPGLFAAGYVEISGRGLYPGLAVSDSQG